MAYDEGLAARVREVLAGDAITEKKMFGGIAWMWRGNMLVGIVGEDLMVRVGPDQEATVLKRDSARPMDFTGKPMKGYVFVAAQGTAEDIQLAEWVKTAKWFVKTLPAK